MHRFLSPKEDVIDLLPDEGPQPQELPVDPMQDGLEEVPLPRVLAVKQLQQLQMERRWSGSDSVAQLILIVVYLPNWRKNNTGPWNVNVDKCRCNS